MKNSINSDQKKKETDIETRLNDITRLRIILTLKSSINRMMNGCVRYSILYTGRIPNHCLRNFLYRHLFHLGLGKNVVLYGGSEIRSPYNIRIGTGSIIGDASILDGRNGIIIGKYVNFSTGVWIWTEQHDPQSPYFFCDNKVGTVVIGDRAWISCRVTILPGVHIGEGAVVAAGAVVTKDLEPFGIYAGIPAKKIGDRNRKLVYEFQGEPLWFY